MSENKIVNPSGSCKGNLGLLGLFVPNEMTMTDQAGLLRFQAWTGKPTASGQLVAFELPANIQSGTHDEWARMFGIYRYGVGGVENWRGISGSIELVVNRVRQEFSALINYNVRAPDQSEFQVTVNLRVSGFNTIIIPS
jgi:hypothetical protein